MTVDHVPNRPPLALQIVRWAVIVVPFVLLAYLVNQRFVVFSDAAVTYHPERPEGRIKTRDLALVRAASRDDNSWIINNDEFAFRAIMPRVVSNVRLELELTAKKIPYLLLTATGAADGDWSKLLKSTTLDALDWNAQTEGEITLWQRPDRIKESFSNSGKKTSQLSPVKQFPNQAAWRRGPVNPARVALLDLDQYAFFHPRNYSPRTTMRGLGTDIRGPQTIYAFAANEDIRIAFKKTDMNLKDGRDPLTVRVRRADSVVSDPNRWLWRREFPDDGLTNHRGTRGQAVTYDIVIPQVQAGMYVIEFVADDEVLIRDLKTSQQVFSFVNRLYLANGPIFTPGQTFKPLTVTTSIHQLRLWTFHNEGRQVVNVNGGALNIKNIRQPYDLNLKPISSTVNIPKGDMVIEGPGLITIPPFILPQPMGTSVSLTNELNLEPYDYLLAPYIPQPSEAVVFRYVFPTDTLNIKDKALKFSLRAAGLRQSDGQLALQRLRVTFDRGPFPWDKIWGKVKSTFQRSKS